MARRSKAADDAMPEIDYTNRASTERSGFTARNAWFNGCMLISGISTVVTNVALDNAPLVVVGALVAAWALVATVVQIRRGRGERPG